MTWPYDRKGGQHLDEEIRRGCQMYGLVPDILLQEILDSIDSEPVLDAWVWAGPTAQEPKLQVDVFAITSTTLHNLAVFQEGLHLSASIFLDSITALTLSTLPGIDPIILTVLGMRHPVASIYSPKDQQARFLTFRRSLGDACLTARVR